MTTTYTSNLGLAKPATGDTGWGTTINDRTTAMVEEAIAGKSTINTWSGDSHTLTESNGASSEARGAILHCTDTGGQISGATATVVVPAKTKLYCVINETGHNVLVKTPSGTGITIPTAKQLSVACDGVNVKEQDNHSAAFSAGQATVSGQVTTEILKISSSSSVVVADIKDQDDMASNSSIALATQQSIKAYADATGSIRRTEIIKPWDANSRTITSSNPTDLPYTNVGPGGTPVTIADFTLYGNSRTVSQDIDLNITGQLIRDGWGPSTEARRINVWVVVQRKSKSATGTSIGTVAVVAAHTTGYSASFYKKIEVSGDQTHFIDSFSSIAEDASGTNARPVMNATYNPTTNRTSIYYDNGSATITMFNSTSDTVFVSASRFASPGTYVTANPFDVLRYADADKLTFDISNYVSPSVDDDTNNVIDTRKTIQLPTLRFAPNGTAGDIDVKVNVTCARLGYEGQYHFYALQVDQTNNTRPL